MHSVYQIKQIYRPFPVKQVSMYRKPISQEVPPNQQKDSAENDTVAIKQVFCRKWPPFFHSASPTVAACKNTIAARKWEQSFKQIRATSSGLDPYAHRRTLNSVFLRNACCDYKE